MTDYGVLFGELAIPRLVGTPNHQTVRGILKRELHARDFDVAEHVFTGKPSRALFGTPRVVHGVNLIAVRPAARPPVRPSLWLVAHYDSKGQPISMALRLLGFVALLLGIAGLFMALIPAVIVLVLGLIIASQNRVNNNSPGAIDNAAALVAVFMTIDQLSAGSPLGVIFPDAEEYGLVGARALAADHAELFANATVINLDGIDDIGRPTVFAHRPGKIGSALASTLQARAWRWLPVVVDGIVLARVARECVTIMKGNSATMRVVHRPADSTDRVRLDGAANVAAALARVLRPA